MTDGLHKLQSSVANMPPAHWLRVSLRELGQWNGGRTPRKSNSAYWVDGTIPWVSPKDMKGDILEETQDHLTIRAVDEEGVAVIAPGSLLFVVRSGILSRTLPMSVTLVSVTINQDMRALTPVREVNPEFLLLQLRYRESELLSSIVKQGTTVESVDLATLMKVEVAIPPLDEQELILRRLKTVMDSIKSARIQLNGLRELVARYRQVALERILDAPRQPVDDVEYVRLGEIATITSGLTLGKRNPPDSKLVRRPYLRVANVQRGSLNLEDVRTVLVSESDASRFMLKPGDILMNEGGDSDKLGRGWVWHGEIPDCVHQNHVYRVRLLDPDMPPDYVSMYANEVGRYHFEQNATQTTNLASISKRRLASLLLPKRSADEARAVLEQARIPTGVAEHLADKVGEALAALDVAERGALRRAFTGRLAVQSVRPPLKLSKPVASARRRRAPRSHHIGGTQPLNRLRDILGSWPAEGYTFPSLQELIPSDYESLKEAVFELLEGERPELQQRYDDIGKVMRLHRRRS